MVKSFAFVTMPCPVVHHKTDSDQQVLESVTIETLISLFAQLCQWAMLGGAGVPKKYN